ncbi:Heat shock protein hsp98 [Penicillium atrosanguineum]|uniref:Heat shock protein hsp98 n=1 Tax=Penicillium atrosanguineum TaxID=1132637 RepID=UPI0023986671|nr:Heat shock protein hsp98 [Penicillium atrosanguineum]KAJ5146833.1 DNA repair and recombination protein [Penicillium atrosanguineum]KAJ5314682.1 Heat shock protein hsp98 [Penicillium atrosanguineum]
MVFKPFKPPSIRKPETSMEETEDSHPPAKKPRLEKDEPTPADTRPPPSLGARKPLVPVRNGKDSSGKPSKKAAPKPGAGERYFNALWRKPTTKKNKTWDGDAIIVARGTLLSLRDVGGKDMGRVIYQQELEPGKMLYISGREVEIDSEIPRAEYLATKPAGEEAKPAPTPPKAPVNMSLAALRMAMGKNPAKPAAPNATTSLKRTSSALEDGHPSNASITPTFAAYKAPLLENTVVSSNATKAVPRHDPNAPGALVMPRPKSVPEGKQIVDVVVDPLLVKSLRQHQREGVQFLYECVMGMRDFNGEGAILADDMGLGKTLQTIALLWTLLKQNPIAGNAPVIKKALIVCPVTLINNWRKEFRKWLGNERIGVFVLDDNRRRLTDFTKGKAYSVMIVGYEKLRTVHEALARGAGVDIIIADEGHRLKTLQNKSGQAIQNLNATKRVILSGTPIQNDLREFFAAVDLINPGILGNFKAFIKEFETPIVRSRQPEATSKDIEKGESRNEELRELTSKFILRRTADVLAKYLPPKSEYVLFCRPTPAQANIYQAVLASPIFQTAMGNAESALQLITILKKLCNSPSLLTAKNNDNSPSETVAALLSSLPPALMRHFSPSASAKVRVLDQLLDSIRSNTSEKIVLVSNYTSTLNLLATLLSSLGLSFLRLDGSTPAQKRQPLVDDFNRQPAEKCFAFLLSAKAGGTGLNLIGASRLVLFDVDWNPATDIQAMARIHRDGQKHHCRIYRVILKGSLEEKIWQRQVTKLGLADSVMEHKDSVSQFSTAELRDLFRLDQESICQTHDLVGCDCGGRGIMSLPSSGTVTPKEESEVEELSDDGSCDSLPDDPCLLKASKVDMDEQERSIRQGTHRGQRYAKNGKGKAGQKDKMHQSLAQYAHIDPALLSGETDEDLSAAVDDDVLVSLLKDECNRIGYIFKKTSGAEVETKEPEK